MKKIYAILLFTFLLVQTIYAQPSTTGLVAYWPMNGNFTDAGPGNIVVTNIGSTATSNNTSTASTAMAFANTIAPATPSIYATSAVTSAINFAAGTNFSFSLSFKLNAIPANGSGASGLFDNMINSAGYGAYVSRNSGGAIQINFNCRNGILASTSATTISLNTWYHLTCVRSGTGLSMYVNGNLVATGTEGATNAVYSSPARFGTLFFSGYSPPQYNGLNGALDELRIYNRALTAAEVTTIASFALPIKLTNFAATLQQTKVSLNWQTAQEQNSSYFEIERSTDGQNFTTIQNIAAAGSSSVAKNYTYTDNLSSSLLQSKTLFYRLKMVDLDGTNAKSKIIPIHLLQAAFSISLSPNPVKNVLQVQTSNISMGLTNFSIINASGKIVKQQEELLQPNQTVSIDLSNLPIGNYILKASNKTQTTSTAFVKSN
jgi:Concanavalin A-like lectin/glucanases superfamily/Secretion system C-terminal sorting domain